MSRAVKYVARVLMVLMLGMGAAMAADLEVRIKAPERPGDTRDDYFVAMLDLALSKTADEGSYAIEVQAPATQSRAIENLKQGALDVIWTIPTEEREATMRPIRIPLEKGLLGYRVFLIREGDQARFDTVTSLDVLKKMLAGQGLDWNSTHVMEENRFRVRRVGNYDSLFTMLRDGRFDYFPRGLNEAWAELAAHPDDGLAVERGILLRYRTTSYFFTRQDDSALAGRIERGLRLALADGSFDRLLTTHPTHRGMFAAANLAGRRVFEIPNPYLPPTAPADPVLWTIPDH
ncbi:substrate-binding periplasmic protein [Pararhodospirillum oryzae]|nr:transporter substrate-binding domain-containing protein [Pararhodospirillum oryzae]